MATAIVSTATSANPLSPRSRRSAMRSSDHRPWTMRVRYRALVQAPVPDRQFRLDQARKASDLAQHGGRVADLELAGRLHVDGLHHPVLHQHGEPLASLAQAGGAEVDLQAQLAGEVAGAVAEHADAL